MHTADHHDEELKNEQCGGGIAQRHRRDSSQQEADLPLKRTRVRYSAINPPQMLKTPRDGGSLFSNLRL
jgi:hypothetical protein